jgi:glutamate racemase
VVGCGHYRIVGDSLAHNLQETILIARTIGSMVKTMKQELKIDNTLPQCSDALASSIFIELSNSLAGEDLTTPPSLMKLLKGIFQFGDCLSLKPSTLVGRI